ncbi:LamG-like jellyroll fold domain-containing protein [Psychromonas aquimarina]|uniref:LamG-like jellyroll fold domain-containing protein n=1 Tax=Psychromonas aquimarina TaxID=444919 RepID=UPI0004192281|nr:LamG-like jellyroll fold domain-containing protein [Psychromonas aquimarina]
MKLIQSLTYLLFIFTSNLCFADPVSTTPVAKWFMDKKHDSLLVDEVNTFYKAENLQASFLTYGSPPTWSTDTPEKLSGYSLKFNGLSSGLVVPANNKLATSSFSTVVWVKPEAITEQYQSIYSSRGEAQGAVVYIAPNGQWELWLQSPDGWSKTIGPKVKLGEWTHIAVTFDAHGEEHNGIFTGTAFLYINGEEVSLTTQAKYQPNSTSNIGIGYRGSSNQFFFQGNVAQTEVFEEALSPNEISSHYSSNVVPGTLIAQWLMNEGEGNVVEEPLSKTPDPNEVLLFNHPGNLVGGPVFSDDSVTGHGYSISLDGRSQGAWVEANDELNVRSFSLSLWVKPDGTGGDYQTPLASRGSSGGYQIYLTPDKRWQFWLNSGGNWTQIGNGKAKLGHWQHIIATFQAENEVGKDAFIGTARLYLNGEIVGEANDVAYNLNRDARMGIGYRGSSEQYFFEGNIDLIEVVSGAYSTGEVLRKSVMPISSWNFFEGYGDFAFDSFGESVGSLKGSPTWTKVYRGGVEGLGLKLAGNQGVDVEFPKEIKPVKFSLETWAAVERLNGKKQTIWSFVDGYNEHALYINEQGKWEFSVGDGTEFNSLLGENVIVDKLSHIVITFDSIPDSDDPKLAVGTAQLYVNGELQISEDNIRLKRSDANKMSIGYEKQGERRHLTGVIDKLSLFSQALNRSQVSHLYRMPSQRVNQSHWDNGQAEFNADKVNGPIISEGSPLKYPGLYKRERELFDYDPRYYPNMVTFDNLNREVIVAGTYEEKDDNSTVYPSYGFPGNQFIQRKSIDGWESFSVKNAVRTAFNESNWNGRVWSGSKLIHERVEFDSSGDAYLLACIDEPISGVSGWMLLYSEYGDHQFTKWKGYSLPSKAEHCKYQQGHYNFQAYIPYINRDVPPTLIYDQSNLVPIEKNGEGLVIKKAQQLIKPESAITEFIAGYSHSGGMNSSVTVGDYTHFVFARLDSNLGNNTTDTDIYYSSYNHSTGTVSMPEYLTSTGSCCLSPDNHNIPFILIDSEGKLHVMAGSHQKPFKYLTAKTDSSGNVDGKWSDAVEVVSLNGDGDPFNTYPGLVIDRNDTIHMVFRKVDEFDRYNLHYMRKKKGQEWEDIGSMVIPASGTYSVYYHKLSISPNGDLYLNYFFYHHFLSDDSAEEYRKRWPLELIETGGTADINLYSGIKAHNGVLLKSSDGGSTWDLFGTSESEAVVGLE